MKKTTHPFTTTPGADLPLLVGRHEIVEDFALALEEGPGSHERISLLVGLPGSGKTVVLKELEAQARHRGWMVISETARKGFVDQIIRRLRQERARHVRAAGSTDISARQSWQRAERNIGPHDGVPRESLREAFDATYALLEELDHSNGATPGIMVALDGLHDDHTEELIEFAVAVQHLVREGRDIAVVIAALPHAMQQVLASKEGRNPITFLRRANRVDVGQLSDQ